MKAVLEFFELIRLLFSSSPSEYDEVVIHPMKYFPFKGFSAMMWCGRLITRIEDVTALEKRIKYYPAWKNHEEIHLQQAKRYKTWLGYYLRYIIEWFKGNPLLNWKSGAYYTIPFEVEAYANEDNLDYQVEKNLWKSKYNIKKRFKTFKLYYYTIGWKNYLKNYLN